MLTRLLNSVKALIRGTYTVTDDLGDEWLINGTAATVLAVGDLVMLKRPTVNSRFDYTTVILPTTAGIAGTAAQFFGVVMSLGTGAGAVGSSVRVRFEGDVALLVTTNVAADTNLTGTDGSVAAADAVTGNIIIAISKEAGAGVKRCYFNGFGIAVSA